MASATKVVAVTAAIVLAVGGTACGTAKIIEDRKEAQAVMAQADEGDHLRSLHTLYMMDQAQVKPTKVNPAQV